MKSILAGLGGPSVFEDISKLDFDFVPDELPYRDEQANKLLILFRPLLTTNKSQRIMVTGSVGTGKTALSKRFCMDFEKAAGEFNSNIEWVHVNCRKRKSDNMVMLKIINHFQSAFPDRGFAVAEMLDILKRDLKKRNCKLIIILDEVDVLLKRSGPDLLYALTRFDDEEESIKGSISLILVSPKYSLDILDPATLSTITRSNKIELGNYSKRQLWGILEKRVDMAFKLGAVDADVPEMIADASSNMGDARYAIELLERAGMLADEKRSDRIKPEHVRAAVGTVESHTTKQQLATLSKHKKLTLLAITRAIKKQPYTNTGEVENIYHVLCEEYAEPKRGHTQFWNYLKDLDAQGIIKTQRSTQGTAGTTTVISLEDIPAEVLENALMSMLS